MSPEQDSRDALVVGYWETLPMKWTWELLVRYFW